MSVTQDQKQEKILTASYNADEIKIFLHFFKNSFLDKPPRDLSFSLYILNKEELNIGNKKRKYLKCGINDTFIPATL